MCKQRKTCTPEEYAEIFNQGMQAGVEIKNSKGETLIFKDDERWEQCYNADDPVRAMLPASWFVSENGHVISAYGGKLEWLLKDEGYGYPGYRFYLNGRIKHLPAHSLVGLVLGSERFGAAKRLIDEKGVYSFGISDRDENVQCHHQKGQAKHPECKNDADNIMFLTSRAHKVVHAIPPEDSGEDRRKMFLERLSALSEEECGGNLIIAMRDGDELKLTDGVDLTPEQLSKIRCAVIYLDEEVA